LLLILKSLFSLRVQFLR